MDESASLRARLVGAEDQAAKLRARTGRLEREAATRAVGGAKENDEAGPREAGRLWHPSDPAGACSGSGDIKAEALVVATALQRWQ